MSESSKELKEGEEEPGAIGTGGKLAMQLCGGTEPRMSKAGERSGRTGRWGADPSPRDGGHGRSLQRDAGQANAGMRPDPVGQQQGGTARGLTGAHDLAGSRPRAAQGSATSAVHPVDTDSPVPTVSSSAVSDCGPWHVPPPQADLLLSTNSPSSPSPQ